MTRFLAKAKPLLVGFCVAMLAVNGCGGQRTERKRRIIQAPQTADRLAAGAPPQPGVRCPGPSTSARTLTFTTHYGARLDGALIGSGRRGAVLLPEYPGSYCGWWPYAVDLAQHGIHVLLFDYHCQGLSSCGHDRLNYLQDTAAAVATLKAHGARSIALVGASFGGALALATAASQHPAALVDLSGEPNPARIIPGVHLAATRFAAKVHAPALFAVARRDHYVSVNEMRAVEHATASDDKALKVLPRSAGHGWDMLTHPTGGFTALATRIIAFIKTH